MFKYPILAALFFFASFLSAQPSQSCANPSDSGAPTAAEACVRCVFDTIRGNNYDHVAFSGPSFCSGQITPLAPDWFAFSAGLSTIGFQLQTSNCVTGDGLQMAVSGSPENPSDATVLACSPGQGGGVALTLSHDQYVPGKTYYLLICGKNGDVCDYTLFPTQPGAADAPAVAALPAGALTGPASVCPGATVVYTIPPAAGASHYLWQIPIEATLLNDSGTGNYLEADTGTNVLIVFGNPGGQVRVKPWSACDNSAPFVARPVSVAPIPLTILPPLHITADDLPFFWQNDQVISENPGANNFFEVILTSYLGCDSIVRQTVIVSPPLPGTTKGQVFWDLDGDGFQDGNETSVSTGVLVRSSSGELTTTNTIGNFTLTGLSAGDSIWAVAPAGAVAYPAFRLYNPNTWNDNDFGISFPPDGYDLRLTILNQNAFRPGFPTNLLVQCHNFGTAAVQNAELWIGFPYFLEYQSATPLPDLIADDSLYWYLGTMAAGEIRTFHVTLYTPVAIPAGTPVLISGNLQPVATDVNIANNFVRLDRVVGASYDPNDKQVEPAYLTPAMLAGGARLEYTIRFQNTGTLPAEFVRILDTLQSEIDPASFRFIAASHPCEWKIKSAGIVDFYFPDIQLPDSTSNEPGSHGFVKFSVQAKPGLDPGDLVENFCDIYFDFNAPVRTNTAGTQIVYFIPGEFLTVNEQFSLRPNPAAFSVLCRWKKPAPAAGTLRLFDMMGLPRLTETVEAGTTTQRIELQSVPAGMYFVVLEAGGLVLAKPLVVVQAGSLGTGN